LSHTMLGDARFFALLRRIDEDLAAQRRAEGCPCGGALHTADYVRKPRGGPDTDDLRLRTRLSLCCAREGCRRRATPPSVRFLGRRVYLGAVVVLATALRSGVSPARFARVRELFDVSAETLARWRAWWRETFPETAFWRSVRGRFARPVTADDLPAALLERFDGCGEYERVVACLRFIAPITTGPRGAGSSMGA